MAAVRETFGAESGDGHGASMKEYEHRGHDGVGKHLDMGSLALAAIGAGGRECKTSFDVMFYLAAVLVVVVQATDESHIRAQR